MSELYGRKVLIFVGNDYEDMELQYPKYRLIEAGAQVVIAGLEAGAVYRGKHGYPEKSQRRVDELSAADFDGVVIPGGWMPDRLRREESVKKLVRQIDAAGRLVASICHGPWIDISACIVKGVRYTSTPAIRDDLTNAGALWEDRPVVVDRNHVSSRRPDDLPDFCREAIKILAAQST